MKTVLIAASSIFLCSANIAIAQPDDSIPPEFPPIAAPAEPVAPAPFAPPMIGDRRAAPQQTTEQPPAAQPVNPAANPDAARSVHLVWAAPPAQVFVNEMTVDESVPGSYFMACGFNGGYFGLQELPDKQKIAIFSVWDTSNTNDPNAVDAQNRVEVIASGDSVQTSRFGGEGTGVKNVWPLGWKTGRTYRFMVRARNDGDRVIYSAYLSGDGLKDWKLMASIRARSNRRGMTGLYSFIEDFRRDGKSLLQLRRARFGNGWVQSDANTIPANQWFAITRARFSADGNTHRNIDAGVQNRTWYLQTGGITKQNNNLGSIWDIAPIQLPD